MKLFVHFDEQGRVLSAAKVHAAEGHAPNPFLHLENQEYVLEMDLTEEFLTLDAHEIVEQYVVDIGKRKLGRRKESGRAAKDSAAAPKPEDAAAPPEETAASSPKPKKKKQSAARKTRRKPDSK